MGQNSSKKNAEEFPEVVRVVPTTSPRNPVISEPLGYYEMQHSEGVPYYIRSSNREGENPLYLFWVPKKGWYIGPQRNNVKTAKWMSQSTCNKLKSPHHESHKVWIPVDQRRGVLKSKQCLEVQKVLNYSPKVADQQNSYTDKLARYGGMDFPEKITVSPYASDLPGKVEKLLGMYIRTEEVRYGCPVYQLETGMAYLFYCQFYKEHDWRISQSLPDENRRAPARIRASAPKRCSPLGPELFWETVDKRDRWNSTQKGVTLDWDFEEPNLEPICQGVLKELGLKDEICSGWLANEFNTEPRKDTELLTVFRSYFTRNGMDYSATKLKTRNKRMYPSNLRLELQDMTVPSTVTELMGLYMKTDKLLYNTPVYQNVDSKGWLFYCEKYENHDWRVSPSLPEEGERAPARIRSYTKHACSPIEPGLFWESVNHENRWNTLVNAVNVVIVDQDPRLESLCAVILSRLGLPAEACQGWLADWCEPQQAEDHSKIDNWLTVLDCVMPRRKSDSTSYYFRRSMLGESKFHSGSQNASKKKRFSRDSVPSVSTISLQGSQSIIPHRVITPVCDFTSDECISDFVSPGSSNSPRRCQDPSPSVPETLSHVNLFDEERGRKRERYYTETKTGKVKKRRNAIDLDRNDLATVGVPWNSFSKHVERNPYLDLVDEMKDEEQVSNGFCRFQKQEDYQHLRFRSDDVVYSRDMSFESPMMERVESHPREQPRQIRKRSSERRQRSSERSQGSASPGYSVSPKGRFPSFDSHEKTRARVPSRSRPRRRRKGSPRTRKSQSHHNGPISTSRRRLRERS